MMLVLYPQYSLLLWQLFITRVQCNFYQQVKTQVSKEDIVDTLPNLSITECVMTCLQSDSCRKGAFKQGDGVCLHLKSQEEEQNNGSKVDVIVFELRKLT